MVEQPRLGPSWQFGRDLSNNIEMGLDDGTVAEAEPACFYSESRAPCDLKGLSVQLPDGGIFVGAVGDGSARGGTGNVNGDLVPKDSASR